MKIAAAVEFETGALAQVRGPRQVEEIGLPRSGDEAGAAPVPVEISQGYRVYRGAFRPISASVNRDRPPHLSWPSLRGAVGDEAIAIAQGVVGARLLRSARNDANGPAQKPRLSKGNSVAPSAARWRAHRSDAHRRRAPRRSPDRLGC